ncbi:hypothetical protein B0J17DRAFT_679602 [Rhizoctonia solani]|nr:hypothetical protein B0J17DRAFT_679602 [Rhizoctonia solani]
MGIHRYRRVQVVLLTEFSQRIVDHVRRLFIDRPMRAFGRFTHDPRHRSERSQESKQDDLLL